MSIMTNSVLGDAPSKARHFLIMINSVSCREGIGEPEAANEWKNGTFKAGPPRKAKNGRRLPTGLGLGPAFGTLRQ